MSIVDETKLKVQAHLTKLGSPTLDSDGDLSLRHGSTQVFVRVLPFGDDHSIVTVFAPVLLNVPLTPELFEYVATEGGYRFGSLIVVRKDDGLGRVQMSHTLLGTFLDPDELIVAVSLLANTANDLDDEMQKRFGGDLFHAE